MANIWRIKTTEEENSALCLQQNMSCIGWPPYIKDSMLAADDKGLISDSRIIQQKDNQAKQQVKETHTQANKTIKTLEDEFIAINTYEAYEHCIASYSLYLEPQHRGRKTSVNTFVNKIQAGDYVWIKYKSHYYVGQIRDDEVYFKYNQAQAIEADMHDYIRRYVDHWFDMGDDSKVPGAVVRAFAFRGSTVQRIVAGYEAVHAYIQYMLQHSCFTTSDDLIINRSVRNEIGKIDDCVNHNETYVSNADFSVNSMSQLCKNAAAYESFKQHFFALLGTDDCEDLLCFWLYYTYGYIVWPSTNKRQTATYECILLDPTVPGKEIYIQVKSGMSQALHREDYVHLVMPNGMIKEDGQLKELSKVQAIGAIKETWNEVYLLTVSDDYGIEDGSDKSEIDDLNKALLGQIKVISTDRIFSDLISFKPNGRGEVLSHLISERIAYWLAIAYNQVLKERSK